MGAVGAAQRGQDAQRVGHLKLGNGCPLFITLVSVFCVYWTFSTIKRLKASNAMRKALQFILQMGKSGDRACKVTQQD